jgi:apolipoprotein N-acyltransferase
MGKGRMRQPVHGANLLIGTGAPLRLVIDVLRAPAQPREWLGNPLVPFFAAALGGLANALSFPGFGWWPLAFIGTPLLLAAASRHRLRVAIASGVLGGAVFWGVHIFWLTVYLGAAPWLALAGLQTLFFAIAAAGIALVWKRLDTGAGPVRRYLVIPAAVASVWTAREWITGVWPYGGFSWGKLAFSQSESPFADMASWIGVTGMSFVIAMVSALVVQTFRHHPHPAHHRAIWPVILLVGLALIPGFPVHSAGSIRVGAAQGNSEAGLLAENRPGRILQDHMSAASVFDEELDLVVLPENAADLDPLQDVEAAAALDELSTRTSAPVVVGTITRSGEATFNSAVVWEAGSAVVGQYDKKHLVPFAEYLPDRQFWFPLAPDLFSLIPRDFVPGDGANVLEVGDVLAGVAICFDIVDDALIRSMVAGGAEVILAPTNNADFGRTDQSAQQLAIARLRAIEAGRSLVNISTVGTSAMIGPDGNTIDRLPTFTPGAMVSEVPLATATTPAMSIGAVVDAAIVGSGVLVAAGAVLESKRRRPPQW